MQRLTFSTLLVCSLAPVAFAQGGKSNAITAAGNSNVVLVDPTGTGTATPLGWNAPTGTGAGSTRGHVMGPDGKVYRSAWTLNGIVVNDFQATTPTITNLVNDTTNRIMGAPYQPCWNFEAEGNFQLVCIDGNGAPPPAPSGTRNLFVVDVDLPLKGTPKPASFAIDGHFSTSMVPMSDMYRNPHVAGEFLGVGFPNDGDVRVFKLVGAGNPVNPTTLITLSDLCRYDAFIHEDQKLYCWHSSSSKIGFVVVDLKAKTQSFLTVRGIQHVGSGYAAVWNEPYELAGKKCYVIQEGGATDTLSAIDLTTGQATPSNLSLPSGSYNTARSVEDAQLTSYKVNAGLRRFRINFGQVNIGDGYVLFPTLAGYSTLPAPIMVDGLELWVIPDLASVLAVTGALGPGFNGVFTSADGRVDVDFPIVLGRDVVWAAARISRGKVVDITNYIMVSQ